MRIARGRGLQLWLYVAKHRQRFKSFQVFRLSLFLRARAHRTVRGLSRSRESSALPGSSSIAWRQLSSSEILARYRATDSKL
jgi:hypothetical protein